MGKKASLKKIKDEVVGLRQSPLYKERVNGKFFPVIGEGSHNAKIMLIGEAPGAKEAATGRPFCGSAGKILDSCLQEAGIERKSVYVTNILKDRPPRNRDPLPEEIKIYAPFLNRQIEIIKPKIIAPLGRFSAEYIMSKFGFEKEIEPITALHGKTFNTESDFGDVKIIPLLHPAVAVYNPYKKKELFSGFLSFKEAF